MQWQFSPRLTSLIALIVVSLAVGGVALGLALARGGSADTPEPVVAQVDNDRSEAKRDGARAADKRADKGDEHDRDSDRYRRGDDGRHRSRGWWGARRVIIVPRFEVFPERFFRGDAPTMRGFGRAQPERQVVRPGGMVIAVGEITAVHEDEIEMYTVLGNDVTIDVGQLPSDNLPEAGASAIVIAERDDDRYVARSLDVLNSRLSDMLDRMRAEPRLAS